MMDFFSLPNILTFICSKLRKLHSLWQIYWQKVGAYFSSLEHGCEQNWAEAKLEDSGIARTAQ